jgi:hypothetical protein
MPPLEERTEYPFQNIRTKNFFWGDGDKVRCIPITQGDAKYLWDQHGALSPGGTSTKYRFVQ